MTDMEQSLYRQVLADHDYVVRLRRHFHRHPELAKEEYETQGAIEQELDKASSCGRISTPCRFSRRTIRNIRVSRPERCTPAAMTGTTPP